MKLEVGDVVRLDVDDQVPVSWLFIIGSLVKLRTQRTAGFNFELEPFLFLIVQCSSFLLFCTGNGAIYRALDICPFRS